MNLEQIFNLINSLTFTFLVVSPTVFVFSVTLLGVAIEKAKQEEESSRQAESKKIADKVIDIENNIKDVKKSGDTRKLTNELEKLKKSQSETEKKIEKIKLKYSSIDFNNTVLYPSLSFLGVVISSWIGVSVFNSFSIIFSIFLFFQILLLFYGLIKIYKSLKLVQEISASKKESDIYDNLKKSIKVALFEHEQDKEGKVIINFVDKTFPLNIVPGSILEINFRVKLEKGTVLEGVNIWFFIPDGFELINPSESESWRQPPDYSLPNIRTVKVKIGKLSLGPYINGKIKIKTPVVSAKYFLEYRIYADGYKGPVEKLILLVG